MQKDERDLLEVLKFELAFLEKGGYGRSPREPWRPQFIFEDSPTCMNYDSKENPGPCGDCVLMQLVPSELRSEEIPCRHIPLNSSGETLDSLYRYGDQYEIEEEVRNWLRSTIQRLEEERRSIHLDRHEQSTPGGAAMKAAPFIRTFIRNARILPAPLHFTGWRAASSSAFDQPTNLSVEIIRGLIRPLAITACGIIGYASDARMSSPSRTRKQTG
jgi:hypothetical protein